MSKQNKTAARPSQVTAESATVADLNNGTLFKILWFVSLGFLVLITTKQLKDQPEKHTFVQEEEVGFSMKSFADGSYQEAVETKLLEQPFMTGLKELKKDFDYAYFQKINMEDVYFGKKQYLYGELMTRATFGDDFIGDAAIREQIRKTKFVQQKLKELDIDLLILFAPGKSTIYPEYLPDAITPTKRKKTNHQTYVSECKKHGINIIDFIPYFKSLKKKTKYPLFPKFGSHWSYYSECLAVDTTIKRIENLTHTDLPNITYKDIKLLDTTRVRDADILGKANIKVPKGNLLAYPTNVGYQQGPATKQIPILGIGDSYFRCFFYLGAMTYAFPNSKQWYYYNSIIPEAPENPEVWELDLKAEILKNKAIVLMYSEMNLRKFSNGFIDDAYLLFSNPKEYARQKKEKDKLNKQKKLIRKDKMLLNKLTKQSQMRGISLDSVIVETALKRIH